VAVARVVNHKGPARAVNDPARAVSAKAADKTPVKVARAGEKVDKAARSKAVPVAK
jgi:hypothetical protein